MKLTLTALTVAATLFAGSASAFDAYDLQKLKNTNKCAECDLRYADLGFANLRGANLLAASLKGANLGNAKLRIALMKGAILCNTTMPDGSVIYSGC